MLSVADVLLQDVQTGVRYPLVASWAKHIVPLGSRLLVSDRKGRLSEENKLMGLPQAAWRTQRWRSFEGVRFGYCRSTLYMSQVREPSPHTMAPFVPRPIADPMFGSGGYPKCMSRGECLAGAAGMECDEANR
uniref:Uncharacterized protein n=1 Tax=Calcidiscus leptoporus TaxID=127549 RepID=A0A7S0NSR8_9EUKA